MLQNATAMQVALDYVKAEAAANGDLAADDAPMEVDSPVKAKKDKKDKKRKSEAVEEAAGEVDEAAAKAEKKRLKAEKKAAKEAKKSSA